MKWQNPELVEIKDLDTLWAMAFDFAWEAVDGMAIFVRAWEKGKQYRVEYINSKATRTVNDGITETKRE